MYLPISITPADSSSNLTRIVIVVYRSYISHIAITFTFRVNDFSTDNRMYHPIPQSATMFIRKRGYNVNKYTYKVKLRKYLKVGKYGHECSLKGTGSVFFLHGHEFFFNSPYEVTYKIKF